MFIRLNFAIRDRNIVIGISLDSYSHIELGFDI